MSYEKSNEFVFLLRNGDFAAPVKMKNRHTNNISFRSAPQSKNKFGTDPEENEIEVTEAEMICDVLFKKRRTRCVSPGKPIPSLKGVDSRDVVSVYVLKKYT